MLYIFRLAVAHIFNDTYAGYSGCQRCLRVWPLCRAHNTVYKTSEEGHEGCFALCEECWRDLPPDERLYYYQRVVEEWRQQSFQVSLFGYYQKNEELLEKWELLKAAVLAGK